MFLGRVVGEVWATRKAADLLGHRLLVVQALDERRDPGAKKVTPVVAADPLGAAVGEHVIVAFGKAARVAALGADGDFALEAAIVGIVDDFDVPGAPEEWRLEEVPAPRSKGADAPRSKSADASAGTAPGSGSKSSGPSASAKKSRGGSL